MRAKPIVMMIGAPVRARKKTTILRCTLMTFLYLYYILIILCILMLYIYALRRLHDLCWGVICVIPMIVSNGKICIYMTTIFF